MVLAGTIADLDLVSALVGPGAYLSSRHAFTHSIVGMLVVIAIAVGIGPLLGKKKRRLQKAAATKEAGNVALIVAVTVAAVLHVLMDLGTSAGVALLWPWRASRFAWDWLPGIDPWILALLLAGILLPELFGLVGSEIGAKAGAPRGRNGAIVALALVLIYVGGRATFHANAVAQLDAHTYRGESPRRIAAFADPVSLTTWRGVVETSTEICTLNVPASEGRRFDPEAGSCTRKPEDSTQLQVAEQTDAVKNFLQVSRFPKASVGTTDGTEVVLRDARDSAEGERRFAVAARVRLDRNGKVTSQELLWASEARLQ